MKLTTSWGYWVPAAVVALLVVSVFAIAIRDWWRRRRARCAAERRLQPTLTVLPGGRNGAGRGHWHTETDDHDRHHVA